MTFCITGRWIQSSLFFFWVRSLWVHGNGDMSSCFVTFRSVGFCFSSGGGSVAIRVRRIR